jgi:hypothetical protein
MKLDGVAAFVSVVESGSINPASQRLRLSKSVVSADLQERQGLLAGAMRLSVPVTFGRMHLGWTPTIRDEDGRSDCSALTKAVIAFGRLIRRPSSDNTP